MTFFRARQALVAADSAPRAAGRLEFLDALRGLAAFAVILQHAGQNLSPSYSAFAFSIFDLGNFGVTVFFLCSGFIIPISLERQGSLRSFWIRRFFRLYPLYWFCIGADLLLNNVTAEKRSSETKEIRVAENLVVRWSTAPPPKPGHNGE